MIYNCTAGLLFPDTPLSDFDKLSYDFYVKGCQSTAGSCPEQFYTNVYGKSEDFDIDIM